MHEMIGNEVSNVESAMIQVVGRVQDTECRSCLQDHGPWVQCVVLDGPSGIVCVDAQTVIGGRMTAGAPRLVVDLLRAT
ncbi:hypothetical protein N7519_007447 [Penicillium mononematosum]|uniref:uncharacterized protein n=1 Tax=Penicillium mononematosum TaxID=268346 RepID=UPI002548DD8F|nr:uncharacterized protein N7519_007447 [Penicillium mononematosum]KAJ6186146.1 hypothetical protein N7519_007447 [Penicillium mononematosum]